MKTSIKTFLSILLLSLIISGNIYSQSPQGKNFGFGIILGEPTGLTLKYWSQRDNAFVFDIGASYFGSPRIGVDYLWHFNAFDSDVAKLYAGLGGAVGIGEGKGFWYRDKKEGFYFRSGNALGLGVRGVFGVNFIPRASPIELFFEVGALVGITPEFGSAADVGLGIRFYP